MNAARDGRGRGGARRLLLRTAAALLIMAASANTPQLTAIQQHNDDNVMYDMTSGEGVVVLSLQDALERAMAHNPEYRQAVNRIGLEAPRGRQAWGAFLPNLSVSFGTNQSFRREAAALDFFGNPIANQEIRTVGSSYSNQGANMQINLFRGGQRFHALGEARAQADVTRLTGQRALDRVLAEVQRQFLAAQRHKGRLAVELDLLAARERDVAFTTRRFELAAIGRSDLLATQLELESQRASVTRARGDFEKGLLALQKAIGDPGISTLDVEDGDPAAFDPATLDLEGLIDMALQASPRMGEAEAALAVRQAVARRQKASRWPALTLSSSVSRSAYARDQDALFDFNPQDFSGSIGLSVSVPLFTRFETSTAIAEASVEARNAAEGVRQAELDLREEVQSRYVDLKTAWATLQERDRRLEIAGERLRIVREEYGLAIKSIEDLQAAVQEEASAIRDAVDQRYEFALALVGLYEAAGLVAAQAGGNAAGQAEAR